MTEKIEKRPEEQKENTTILENAGRRKAVKTIVGGVTAIAAYNLLPTKWGTPIIEQVFLPAHAATSGSSLHDPCEVTWVSGYQDSAEVVIKVTGFVTPPTGGLPTHIIAKGNPDTNATAIVKTTTADDGTFGGTLTLFTATGIGSVHVRTTVDGADGSANCSIDIPQRIEDPICNSISLSVENGLEPIGPIPGATLLVEDIEGCEGDISNKTIPPDETGGPWNIKQNTEITLKRAGVAVNSEVTTTEGTTNWPVGDDTFTALVTATQTITIVAV
jgi:hypothetical protein